MLTKSDLQQIREDRRKDLDELLKKTRDERRQELDNLLKKTRSGRQQDLQSHSVDFFKLLYDNFVTKDEIEPMKQDIKELKESVNMLKDGFVELNEFNKNYRPLNDSRVGKAHERIDNLEVAVFNEIIS